MVADKPDVGARPSVLDADGPDIESLAGTAPLWIEAKRRVSALTPRQREVLWLMAAGLSNKEIAIELGCSHRTIEIHRSAMMTRIGARSTADAVRIAIYAAIAEERPVGAR